MSRLAMFVVAVLVATMACGCITTSAGIAPSNRPVDMEKVVIGKQVEGTSWGMNILFFIPLFQANTADALDEATTKGRTDTLIDITVDNRQIFFFGILNFQKIKVSGMSVTRK